MKKYIILILVLNLISCGLFETRTPESPTSNKSSYQPPTSPQIVVTNLSNSIIEMNTENYIACLSNKNQGYISEFKFYPNSNASARYPGLFLNWDIEYERRAMNNLFSNIYSGVKPSLVFSNSYFDVLLPDSAIYVSDYEMEIHHNIQTLATKFKGTLQFYIAPNSSGLWSIYKWNDFEILADSSYSNWSIMKARLSN